MSRHSNLEGKILLAAEELFIEKGYDAVSITDIARHVGCNQALVHYYFRTKENLFQQIFKMKSKIIFSHLISEDESVPHFETALVKLIDSYFDALIEHPKLPFFLIQEMVINEKRRTDWLSTFFHTEGNLSYFYHWDKLVKAEVSKGNIRPIRTADLSLHIVSLIAFTFISLPLYRDLFHYDDAQVHDYLMQRKRAITQLILQGIRPDGTLSAIPDTNL